MLKLRLFKIVCNDPLLFGSELFWMNFSTKIKSGIETIGLVFPAIETLCGDFQKFARRFDPNERRDSCNNGNDVFLLFRPNSSFSPHIFR